MSTLWCGPTSTARSSTGSGERWSTARSTASRFPFAAWPCTVSRRGRRTARAAGSNAAFLRRRRCRHSRLRPGDLVVLARRRHPGCDPRPAGVLRQRYSGADLITHLSRHETDIFTDAGFTEDRLFPVTYGVSHRYYVPGDDSDGTSTCWRSDRTAAATTGPCSTPCRHRPGPRRGVPPREPRRAARTRQRAPARHRAACGVPTPAAQGAGRRRPDAVLTYPTGSSVALESRRPGACVVATGTPAMGDYFADGHSGVLVDPQDAEGWRRSC